MRRSPGTATYSIRRSTGRRPRRGDVGGCCSNITMVTFREALADSDELPPALTRMAADAGVIDAIVETDRMIAMLTAAKYRLVTFAHDTQTRGEGAPSHA